MRRIELVSAAVALAVMATGCSSSNEQAGSPTTSSSASKPATAQAAGPCTLPHFGYLIEWRHQPGQPDRAFQISDIDQAKCQPALNSWTDGLPEGPGVCSMIGWASDNRGYDVKAVPAPKLPKAMDKVGDGC